LEEAMELLCQGSGDIRGQEDSVVDPGAEDVDGGRAAATDMLTVEGEELLIADGLEVVGVGVVDEEDPQAIALERAGLDDGGREWQVGVGFAELFDVDHGAGPEAVELLTELAFEVAEEAGLGADEADLLADEEFIACGEEGGLAEAAEGEVKHGGQVAGVGLAMAEVSLLAGELDLIRVEEGVLHGSGLAGEVGGVVVQEGAGPGFVVDAAWFVTEEDQRRVVLGDEGIGHLDEFGETALGGGEAVRLD